MNDINEQVIWQKVRYYYYTELDNWNYYLNDKTNISRNLHIVQAN